MTINLNSSFPVPGATLKRAVQLACWGNSQNALQLIQPFVPYEGQMAIITSLLQGASNDPSEATSLQNRIVAVLNGYNFISTIDSNVLGCKLFPINSQPDQ